MSKELQAQYPTGSAVYAVVLSATGGIWNGSAFETPTLANWTTYAVTLTEQSTTGLYHGNMPALITTAGWYSYIGYLRAGGSPLSTDTAIWSDRIPWSGSAIAVPVVPDTNGQVTVASPTAAAVVTALLATPIESGVTFLQALRAIAAAAGGTLVEPLDRSSTAIAALGNATTPRLASTNSNDGATLTRTVSPSLT